MCISAPPFLSSFLRFFMMLTGYWTHTEGFRLSKSQQRQSWGTENKSSSIVFTIVKKIPSSNLRCFLRNKTLLLKANESFFPELATHTTKLSSAKMNHHLGERTEHCRWKFSEKPCHQRRNTTIRDLK